MKRGVTSVGRQRNDLKQRIRRGRGGNETKQVIILTLNYVLLLSPPCLGQIRTDQIEQWSEHQKLLAPEKNLRSAPTCERGPKQLRKV